MDFLSADAVSHANACAEVLRPLVTEARLANPDAAASCTRHLSVVLENVYQQKRQRRRVAPTGSASSMST